MAGENPALKLFACPNCGANIILRAEGLSLSICCGSCGSIIDSSNKNHEIISKFQINTRIQPEIPLGTRGKIKGELFEVIGFMIRESSGYSWREFLLFNPYKGFRWLVEFDGHWTFVTMLKERPTYKDSSIEYQGVNYKPLMTGSATVKYVLGEFYWRVQIGETVEYGDYIAPPKILSYEGTKDEVVWSAGQYILPIEIKEGFRIPGFMMPTVGVGACQPNPYQALWTSFWPIGVGFSIVMLFINLFTHGFFWNLLVCWALAGLPLYVVGASKNSFERARTGEDE